MEIAFVDLHRQYLSIKEEIDQAISRVINETSFVGGAEVTAFEKAFAQFIGARHCVGCANGTDALEILLRALGIGAGDEVIVPSHSWVSTAEAVVSCGAIPVFVDTLPLKYTIDPSKIAEAVTAKTRAIIPVHLFGLPAEMDEICFLAEKYKLHILEDCAQAHGASYKGKKVGTFGVAAAFSFYPGKNLGAYGDAGCMLTSEEALAEKARMIANHGQPEKHRHLMPGRNSRLDSLQAAILHVKLPYLQSWNELRNQHASRYFNMLRSLPLQLPDIPAYSQPVWHLFVIQCEMRNQLARFLRESHITTQIHYPTILPLLPSFKDFARKSNFPVSKAYQLRILSLPMFPELKEEEISMVADRMKVFFRNAEE